VTMIIFIPVKEALSYVRHCYIHTNGDIWTKLITYIICTKSYQIMHNT